MNGYLSMDKQVAMLQRVYPDGLPEGVQLQTRDVAVLTNGAVEVVYALGQYDVWEPGSDMFGLPEPTRYNVTLDEARTALEREVTA